jgi:hypothetical protein
MADGSIVEVAEHELATGSRIGDVVAVAGRPGTAPRRGLLVGLGEDLTRADAQALAAHAASRTLTPGPTFGAHFTDHRHLLEGAVGRRFPGNPAGHADFLAELNRLVAGGAFRPRGVTSIVARGEQLYAYEGRFNRLLPDGQTRVEALTLLVRPNGEWVTLLRSGEGMAARIERHFTHHF